MIDYTKQKKVAEIKLSILDCSVSSNNYIFPNQILFMTYELLIV